MSFRMRRLKGNRRARRRCSAQPFPSIPTRREQLDNLLKLAIDAHGGLNAWNRLESLQANVSIGGALWDQKQLPGLFNNTRVELNLQYQHVTTYLADVGERIVL